MLMGEKRDDSIDDSPKSKTCSIPKDRPIDGPDGHALVKCDFFFDLFKPEFGTDVEEVHDLGVIQLTHHNSKVNITDCPKSDEEEEEEDEEEEEEEE
nr:unnamed protein product [Haemonchus contortus]